MRQIQDTHVLREAARRIEHLLSYYGQLPAPANSANCRLLEAEHTRILRELEFREARSRETASAAPHVSAPLALARAA